MLNGDVQGLLCLKIWSGILIHSKAIKLISENYLVDYRLVKLILSDLVDFNTEYNFYLQLCSYCSLYLISNSEQNKNDNIKYYIIYTI